MAGPNQTGNTLVSPLSEQMGYGNALRNQVQDNEDEKRKKALAAAANGVMPPTPAPALSSYLGF
jgi:hypothetical protein